MSLVDSISLNHEGTNNRQIRLVQRVISVLQEELKGFKLVLCEILQNLKLWGLNCSDISLRLFGDLKISAESRSWLCIRHKIMNSFNCLDRHIQSLSPHYLRLKRSLREPRGDPPNPPLLLPSHCTLPHSHQRERQKRRLLIKERGKKMPRIQHNRKRKRRREEKDGGHALINERLISTKLITGSWMWGREGWKEGRGKRGKRKRKEECNMMSVGTPMGILSLSFPHNPS